VVVPLPDVGNESVVDTVLNVAVSDTLLAGIVNVMGDDVFVPNEVSPLHPVNVEPAEAVAVNVTAVPAE